MNSVFSLRSFIYVLWIQNFFFRNMNSSWSIIKLPLLEWTIQYNDLLQVLMFVRRENSLHICNIHWHPSQIPHSFALYLTSTLFGKPNCKIYSASSLNNQADLMVRIGLFFLRWLFNYIFAKLINPRYSSKAPTGAV